MRESDKVDHVDGEDHSGNWEVEREVREGTGNRHKEIDQMLGHRSEPAERDEGGAEGNQRTPTKMIIYESLSFQ